MVIHGQLHFNGWSGRKSVFANGYLLHGREGDELASVSHLLHFICSVGTFACLCCLSFWGGFVVLCCGLKYPAFLPMTFFL